VCVGAIFGNSYTRSLLIVANFVSFSLVLMKAFELIVRENFCYTCNAIGFCSYQLLSYDQVFNDGIVNAKCLILECFFSICQVDFISVSVFSRKNLACSMLIIYSLPIYFAEIPCINCFKLYLCKLNIWPTL